MSDDTRVSLDELQRLDEQHQPIEVDDHVRADPQPGRAVLMEIVHETVCHECYLNTNNVAVAVWPCLVHKLLERNREMTDLLQTVWKYAEPQVHVDCTSAYEHLGLHVER